MTDIGERPLRYFPEMFLPSGIGKRGWSLTDSFSYSIVNPTSAPTAEHSIAMVLGTLAHFMFGCQYFCEESA